MALLNCNGPGVRPRAGAQINQIHALRRKICNGHQVRILPLGIQCRLPANGALHTRIRRNNTIHARHIFRHAIIECAAHKQQRVRRAR